MISTVDKLLLTPAQQQKLAQYTEAYNDAMARGDRAGMDAAHNGAERIRATAGYSGGVGGDRYQLLATANAPEGYSGYEKLIDRYAGGGMHAIAAGLEAENAALDAERVKIEAEGKQNQTAARSAAWNTHRLAADGLLTRGLENTGIADMITATALNQASANAYQALLDRQNDLKENDAARAAARADALSDAAELQMDVGAMLGGTYQELFEGQADRLEADRDYYRGLALQQLKREWELEDRKLGL